MASSCWMVSACFITALAASRQTCASILHAPRVSAGQRLIGHRRREGYRSLTSHLDLIADNVYQRHLRHLAGTSCVQTIAGEGQKARPSGNRNSESWNQPSAQGPVQPSLKLTMNSSISPTRPRMWSGLPRSLRCRCNCPVGQLKEMMPFDGTVRTSLGRFAARRSVIGHPDPGTLGVASRAVVVVDHAHGYGGRRRCRHSRHKPRTRCRNGPSPGAVPAGSTDGPSSSSNIPMTSLPTQAIGEHLL